MRHRTLTLAVIVATTLVARHAGAGWDPTKPGPGPAVSAELRANWRALEQGIAGAQLVADNTFVVWAAGDASAPSYWTLSGVGAAIARAGAGMPDTARKWGQHSARVTSAAAAATLSQDLLSVTSYDDGFDGLDVSCSWWTRSAAGNAVRVAVFDGVGQTFSAYHTGSGTWQWLSVTRTLDPASTRITIRAEVAAGSLTGYFSAPTCVLGSVPPRYPQPSAAYAVVQSIQLSGNCSTGDKVRWSFPRPGLITDVQLHALTAPATQDLIVDVTVFDGAAFQSAFTAGARPRLVAGTANGNGVPDSTYRSRTFVGGFGTVATNALLKASIAQCGSGTLGADLSVAVRARVWRRPLEQFLGYAE